MRYLVKTRKFEGPLDLLLELIEKEKLEVSDVSLAQVTDQFLEYIKEHAEIDPIHLADFLVIAAKLLFIKSKILIPEVVTDAEDELSTDELAFRLSEYKKFKQAAKYIETLLDSDLVLVSKVYNKSQTVSFVPAKNVSTNTLLYSITHLLSLFAAQEKREQRTLQETVTISEKISEIEEMLMKKSECRFDEVLKTSSNKTEVVVTFLALLELIKQRNVSVSQSKLFDTITISHYE